MGDLGKMNYPSIILYTQRGALSFVEGRVGILANFISNPDVWKLSVLTGWQPSKMSSLASVWRPACGKGTPTVFWT